jgi:putative phosphoribosyl transferase
MPFENRRAAGRELVPLLEKYRSESPIILALPRGGVPVGDEIARALRAQLDVLVVRKLGVPWEPELGFGAITEGDVAFVDNALCWQLGLDRKEVDQIIDQKRKEVEERVRRFRGGARPQSLRGRTVILVDDGIATGGTARAAISVVKAQRPKRVVLAVPVAAPDSARVLAEQVDDFVCIELPERLYAIGAWYSDFTQVSDDEAAAILETHRREETPWSSRTTSST